jgi:hypothetical protein
MCLPFRWGMLVWSLLMPTNPSPCCRHVASTQMNRESSRSHLIISIIIESTNLQTQSVTRGKLSFVDLAGSER